VEDVLRAEPLGRVARARLREVNRAVYVKELCPPAALPASDRERLVRAFEEERRLLGEVRDSRVVRPLDFGRTEVGTYFLVFDCPETMGARHMPVDPRALPRDEWVRVGAEVCRALAALEERGLTPPVFEPESVALTGAGEVRFLPVQFGGLALRVGLPPAFHRPGGPYPSPESPDSGSLAVGALCFSVGAWLYAMLSGDTSRSMAAVVSAGGRPEPLWMRNPEIRGPVDDAVQRALDPDPARRFPGMAAFAEALEAAAASRAPAAGASAPSAEPVTKPAAEESPALAYGLWALGLAVAGSLAGWILAQLAPPP
jgi:hypothetical protein